MLHALLAGFSNLTTGILKNIGLDRWYKYFENSLFVPIHKSVNDILVQTKYLKYFLFLRSSAFSRGSITIPRTHIHIRMRINTQLYLYILFNKIQHLTATIHFTYYIPLRTTVRFMSTISINRQPNLIRCPVCPNVYL